MRTGIYAVWVLSSVFFNISVVFSSTPPDALRKVSFNDFPEQIIVDKGLWNRKNEMLRGIALSLRYLRSRAARQAYQRFQGTGITRTMVVQSLKRFYLVLLMSRSYKELQSHLRSEFNLYRSIGMDGRGTVKFTGYFQPVYKASRVKTARYRYPIFRKPADYHHWPKPHPTRVALEGYDGLGKPGTKMNGHELAWLETRFEAFMIHVQGSAILEFEDSSRMAVGFAAGTDHPFRGISKEFLRKHNVAWHKLGSFFRRNPNELNRILSRNNRFIFFEKKTTPEAIGSLGVPVIPERSIAVDKLKLPPGAIGIIRTMIPIRNIGGALQMERTSRIVLNLDSGSAIKGPGRVDIFMGTGDEAQRRASSVYSKGQLFYLFTK
jgi:membrane-bound lytic murein transglycosylase A